VNLTLATSLTADVRASAVRLDTYYAQVERWLSLSSVPTDPPAKKLYDNMVALRMRLNRARIAMGAVKPPKRLPVRPPFTLDDLRMDRERMTQDLDRTVERMNTYVYQITSLLAGILPTDPIVGIATDMTARLRTALTTVRTAREAAQKIAPSDYRGTDLLTLI